MGELSTTFDDDLQTLIERQAQANGISAEEYVREAVLMRLLVDAGKRPDAGGEDLLDRVLAESSPSGAPPAVVAAVRDPERLRALRATGLLDSEPEEDYDRLVRLAADALSTTTAAVSLIDRDRQFFKSAVGVAEAASAERPLSHSLCQYAVASGQPLIVEDAREHPELQTNGAVVDGELVSYLGIPLTDAEGHTLGTLCVWDTEPRQWTRGHVQTLEDLARLVTRRIGATQAPSGR